MSDIEKLTRMRFITSKQLIWTVVGLFGCVQVAFIALRPSEEIEWQILGWVLSTNIAAVILAIHGNIEVEKARNLSQQIYTPEMVETIGLMAELKGAIDNESDDKWEEDIKEIAPILFKVIRRYSLQKVRLERLSQIKDDEVFMSAMEEVIR